MATAEHAAPAVVASGNDSAPAPGPQRRVYLTPADVVADVVAGILPADRAAEVLEGLADDAAKRAAAAARKSSPDAITLAEFQEQCGPAGLTLTHGGETIELVGRAIGDGPDAEHSPPLVPFVFSTGTLGWLYAGKAELTIGGVPRSVQVDCKLYLIGSKTPESIAEGERLKLARAAKRAKRSGDDDCAE